MQQENNSRKTERDNLPNQESVTTTTVTNANEQNKNNNNNIMATISPLSAPSSITNPHRDNSSFGMTPLIAPTNLTTKEMKPHASNLERPPGSEPPHVPISDTVNFI